MIFTTKVKIFLKKNAPVFVFNFIRFIADNTLLKVLPIIFKLKVIFFRKETLVTIKQPYGHFSIYIKPTNGYLDQTIYATRNYEPHIANEIFNAINKDDTCLDIGANIGYHTIIMAKKTGSSGKVIAFEPIPVIREQLKKTLTVNNIHNVTIIDEALSDKPGNLELYLSETNIAGSSFVNESGTSIIVNLRTLDSYNYEKVNFIKLDVEGFEYNVLLGAEKTIAKCKPKIIFEFSPTYYRKRNKDDIYEILYFFEKNSYKMIDLEDKKKSITDLQSFIEEFNEGLRSQTNILAIPK